MQNSAVVETFMAHLLLQLVQQHIPHISKASSILACSPDPVQLGTLTLLDNVSHTIHETAAELQSFFGDRLLHPVCTKERHHRSFLPAAVRLRKHLSLQGFAHIFLAFAQFLLFMLSYIQ